MAMEIALALDGYTARARKPEGERFYRGHVDGRPDLSFKGATAEDARAVFEALVREVLGGAGTPTPADEGPEPR